MVAVIQRYDPWHAGACSPHHVPRNSWKGEIYCNTLLNIGEDGTWCYTEEESPHENHAHEDLVVIRWHDDFMVARGRITPAHTNKLGSPATSYPRYSLEKQPMVDELWPIIISSSPTRLSKPFFEIPSHYSPYFTTITHNPHNPTPTISQNR